MLDCDDDEIAYLDCLVCLSIYVYNLFFFTEKMFSNFFFFFPIFL